MKKPLPRSVSMFFMAALLALTACSNADIPREFELKLAGSPAMLERNQRLSESLDRSVTIDLRDTPLRDALDRVAKITGLPLAVDWGTLKDSDMQEDTRVSLQLIGAPAREAFNHLFRSITAPDLEDDSACWLATDGVVVVGTPVTMESHRKTINYPVADILGKLTAADILEPRHAAPKSAIWRAAGPAPQADPDAIDDARDALFSIIEEASSVRPEMWDSGEGTLCVMNEAGGVLVVTAPDEVQRRTYRALQAIRKAHGLRGD